jgi:hypothetical protein
MPFEIRDEGPFLSARLFGVLSHADLVAVAKELERLEDESPVPKNRLCDLTSLEDIEVGFQSVLELADTRTRRALATPVKSALIARRPMHFGFARMFQTLNTNPQIEVRIFASKEEALQWFTKG